MGKTFYKNVLSNCWCKIDNKQFNEHLKRENHSNPSMEFEILKIFIPFSIFKTSQMFTFTFINSLKATIQDC